MSTEIIQCSRCILDTKDDANISFDDNGVCNHCRLFDKEWKEKVVLGPEGEKKLKHTIQRIKEAGKNHKYDCILGLSGGVDSSYLALLTKQFGLRPLCVHFDNGWNSELAVMNIQHIVNKLGYDLNTYVINWEEFRDLQRAYLKASVIDIEAVSDHAIFASLNKLAIDNDIKFILSGYNIVTESVLPFDWVHYKSDYVNILDIHSKFGEVKLKTYPMLNRKLKRQFNRHKIEIFEPLNWIPYNKEDVKKILIKELDWRDYGGKHYESIFTKFYQAYILPVKFGVDKRKAHLSNLICSGQMTKEEAVLEIQKPLYNERELQVDKAYVLKKLGFTEEEFDAIMKENPKSHYDYEFEGSIFNYYPILKPLRPLWHKIANKKNNLN